MELFIEGSGSRIFSTEKGMRPSLTALFTKETMCEASRRARAYTCFLMALAMKGSSQRTIFMDKVIFPKFYHFLGSHSWDDGKKYTGEW